MAFIISKLLNMSVRFVLMLLMKNITVSQLVEFIKEADKKESTNFGKRGHVYRILKRTENALSEHVINAVVELGVLLYKQQLKKK